MRKQSMEINPKHHGYLGNAKARKIHMHSKTSEENIHETWYLHSEPTVVVHLDVLLRFPALIFPSFSKSPSIHTLQGCPKKTLSIQDYERERERKRERERIMRELQKCTNKKSYQLILKSLFIKQTSIFFIFHYFISFSSPHETCDLSPSFSPNFHYFHK